MEPYVPWFLACNPHRFPYWFGKPEPRNKVLHEVLQNFFKNYKYSHSYLNSQSSKETSNGAILGRYIIAWSTLPKKRKSFSCQIFLDCYGDF